jgi:hypothetical protein
MNPIKTKLLQFIIKLKEPLPRKQCQGVFLFHHPEENGTPHLQVTKVLPSSFSTPTQLGVSFPLRKMYISQPNYAPTWDST